MNYALPLGLFWVFKYLFAIGGEHQEVFKYIYSILSIGTPIIYYILLIKYRDTVLGGKIQYGECMLFCLLISIFASIPEAVVVSLNLMILNPQLVTNQNEMLLQIIEKAKMISPDSMEYINLNSFLSSYGGLYYTACNVLGNIVIGFLLSLFLGYFVSRNQTSSNIKQ